MAENCRIRAPRCAVHCGGPAAVARIAAAVTAQSAAKVAMALTAWPYSQCARSAFQFAGTLLQFPVAWLAGTSLPAAQACGRAVLSTVRVPEPFPPRPD